MMGLLCNCDLLWLCDCDLLCTAIVRSFITAHASGSHGGLDVGVGGGGSLGLLLAAQRVQRHVRRLLAADEHGTEGWAHAGAAVKLSHLHATDDLRRWAGLGGTQGAACDCLRCGQAAGCTLPQPTHPGRRRTMPSTTSRVRSTTWSSAARVERQEGVGGCTVRSIKGGRGRPQEGPHCRQLIEPGSEGSAACRLHCLQAAAPQSQPPFTAACRA